MVKASGRRVSWAWAAGLVGLLQAGAAAQTLTVEARAHLDLGTATHLVVPQARGFALRPYGVRVLVERVEARVEIVGRSARTTLEIAVSNPSSTAAEAVLLLPVPHGAAVDGFDFEGAGASSSARLLPADEARRTYDGIVAQLRDPALLEFAGHGLVRSSVFPVPAGGVQRVRIAYHSLLGGGAERIDYLLPRSESLAGRVPWSISVDVRGEGPIATVYSPSHALDVERLAPDHLRVAAAKGHALQPGPFRLALIPERGPVSASLYAYPDAAAGGGYLLLVAGLPAHLASARPEVRREVTLVLDRSGSMNGGKIEQARAAALGVIEALEPDERFQIVDFAAEVGAFAPTSVPRSPENARAARAYLDDLRPLGGTNIAAALERALHPEPAAGYLPIVLFLTDGLPTVGLRGESEIARAVEAANVHARRVFSFGVGADVNVPLLDRLSDTTRAVSTFVAPGEDVEEAVASVFQRLYGPLLTRVELLQGRAADGVGSRRVLDLVPRSLPDLYQGDSLVVLARYTGEGPLHLDLGGELLGTELRIPLRFELDAESTANAFVPRLWATRQIAYLVDEVRQAGADPALAGADPFSDPRLAELREEILRLSTAFGVLTEHTAFLALEGSRLDDWGGLVASCGVSLDQRAIGQRWGVEALGQGRNFNAQKLQAQVNYDNRMWGQDLEQVAFGGVQQIADRTFYARGGRWIDARLVAGGEGLEPDQVVTLGDAAHRALVESLLGEGREACLSLPGEILLRHGGRKVLVRNAELGADGSPEGAAGAPMEPQAQTLLDTDC